jgi:hypothetical protein
MAQVNGLAVATGLRAPIPTASQGVGAPFSPERIQELLGALSEPFDPDLVAWRVTNTAPGKHGKRGQVVAYAEQRAYTDRLNELFSPRGWTREYTVQAVQNFELPAAGAGKDRTTIISAKVLVTCKVMIHGLGTHSGTGEEWARDENALTRAEAQAFKRACSCFGLGRYFYDLPRTWVDLDEYNKPLELPRLPDWAVPGNRNGGRRHEQDASTTDGTATGGRPGPNGTQVPRGSGAQNGGLHAEELRQTVKMLSAEVGFSLTRFVVRGIAGKDDIDEVRKNEQLTHIMERLEDLARGVRRLKAAIEMAGEQTYRHLCSELSLPSDSIDDIPNRDVLRQLVQRMEAAAANRDRGATGSPVATETGKSDGAGTNGIAQLRERLLVEARRASTSLRKGIGEVIATASQGSFTFAELTKLTDADCGKVEAALEELRRIAS